MASAVVSSSSSSTAFNSAGKLYPSLLGIANAMQKAEYERKERLGLALESLEPIDTWANT